MSIDKLLDEVLDEGPCGCAESQALRQTAYMLPAVWTPEADARATPQIMDVLELARATYEMRDHRELRQTARAMLQAQALPQALLDGVVKGAGKTA